MEQLQTTKQETTYENTTPSSIDCPHQPRRRARRRCEVKITQDTAIQIYIWTFAICFAVTLIGIEIYQSIWGGQ